MKNRALTWRERLVQSQRDESFTEWLRARLLPQSDEEARELEQRALDSARRSAWDTHPALRDRLAALPEGWSAVGDSTPAVHLLLEPDAVAQRLIAELEHLANEEERQETDRRRRWLRKEQTSYGRRREVAQQVLAWALNEYGLGTSVSWALGWAFIMLGDWRSAEGYLLDATLRRPHEATLWSLLGLSQWWQGSLREAQQNFRQALTLEPQEPRHRILLMQVLLAAGRPKEALQEWEILVKRAPTDFEVMVIGVRAHLLLGRMEEATRLVRRLEQEHPGVQTFLEVAHAYEEAGLPEQARPYLERVSQEGFYPQALLGLARLASRRQEYDQARAYLRSALDVTRELSPQAQSPWELLGPICRELAALNEPVASGSLWTVHLDLSGCPVHIPRLSLMVFAPTLESAQDCVDDLIAAMLPGETLPRTAVTWDAVPSGHSPESPLPPGIYGVSLE
jgi:tetratricopeptide (TPR) repeat protein